MITVRVDQSAAQQPAGVKRAVGTRDNPPRRKPQRRRPQVAQKPRDVGALLRHVLRTPKERRILAAYAFDGLTQKEIARRERMPRETVGWWIRRAISRLAEAGLKLRAHESAAGEMVYLDPSDMARLKTEPQHRTGGPARWVDSEKQNRQE